MWTRRQILTILALGSAAAPRPAVAMGEDSALDLPLVQYAGTSWNLRPTALRRLLMEVEMTTSVPVVTAPTTVALIDLPTVASPLAILSGDRAFDPWTQAEREAVALFLAAGGLLYIDSAEGRLDGGFVQSVERELAAIVPGEVLRDVDQDHVLYRSFYLVDRAPGRLQTSSVLKGLVLDERLAVIVNHNDALGAWARDSYGNYEYQVSPGGETQRTMAYRFGVNLVMYALCLDYKADQVHVNYLLRRRRWRVD
jgi:hypothetical protein